MVKLCYTAFHPIIEDTIHELTKTKRHRRSFPQSQTKKLKIFKRRCVSSKNCTTLPVPTRQQTTQPQTHNPHTRARKKKRLERVGSSSRPRAPRSGIFTPFAGIIHHHSLDYSTTNIFRFHDRINMALQR